MKDRWMNDEKIRIFAILRGKGREGSVDYRDSSRRMICESGNEVNSL